MRLPVAKEDGDHQRVLLQELHELSPTDRPISVNIKRPEELTKLQPEETVRRLRVIFLTIFGLRRGAYGFRGDPGGCGLNDLPQLQGQTDGSEA